MAFLTFRPFYADSSAPQRWCQNLPFCCCPPLGPRWGSIGIRVAPSSRLASPSKTSVSCGLSAQMGLNRNPHFPLTAQRRLNRNQGCQETLQIPCFFADFSSSTFLTLFLFPSSHTALACKSTFYLHENTYFTTCLDCLLCSRLGKAAKTAPRCQKSALCS